MLVVGLHVLLVLCRRLWLLLVPQLLLVLLRLLWLLLYLVVVVVVVIVAAVVLCGGVSVGTICEQSIAVGGGGSGDTCLTV